MLGVTATFLISKHPLRSLVTINHPAHKAKNNFSCRNYAKRCSASVLCDNEDIPPTKRPFLEFLKWVSACVARWSHLLFTRSLTRFELVFGFFYFLSWKEENKIFRIFIRICLRQLPPMGSTLWNPGQVSYIKLLSIPNVFLLTSNKNPPLADTSQTRRCIRFSFFV